MPKPVSKVSAAEISRLAGVTRATVSNWRRRHDDFPRAIAGTETRPVFDLHAVQAWMAEHGMEPAASPAIELRTLVRSHATPESATRLMETLRRSGTGWQASGADKALVREVSRVLETADAEAIRAAVDTLAEQAMGDTAASGVYVTPANVAELMVHLANPGAGQPIRSVLDPACGSGSLLLAAAQAGAVDLYGQDVMAVQAQRARLLIEAGTDREPTVETGDSLTADAFPGLAVDAVLCNPPYGLRDWGSAELAFDTRWDYGLPPRGESELAWVQHAIAHLRPGGTAVLLLPPAVASRNSGRKIRANLVRTGALRAVVGLAPGVAQPWHVGLQIWVLRRPDPAVAVPDSLLFVDGSAALPKPETVAGDPFVRVWRNFDGEAPEKAAESGFAAVVRSVDLLDEDVDFTPARYVRSALDSTEVSGQVDEALGRLAAVTAELSDAAADVRGWTEAAGRVWRFVSIADLAAHGQLEWIRASARDAEPAVAGDTRRVLTATDVAGGEAASEGLDTATPATIVEVAAGDVLMPAVRSDRHGGRSARVAIERDAGAILGPHVHAFRVDSSRLDPWFVAGFLIGADNIAATRTSTVRFDPSKLRIPVLSLAEQQRYGDLFRRLFVLRAAARRAIDVADLATGLIGTGLTAGALEPVGDEESTETR
ncbi:N-6 DNA methylase [Nocardia sp. NPDC052254]|uniref:N-6 DNA methylase n=1 Tax=Nocardia sp. NPDC052254 TaxID=3155681 RepID=UPI0034150AAC